MHLLESAVSSLLLFAFVTCATLAHSLESQDAVTPYKNPIISGFAPDPSCIRVDEQFFCVTSSFSAFPGIPVYTSRDLVQWKQIGNVLSRSEQLPALANVNQTTGGIWAATIRHHDGTFYVTTTLVFDGDLPDAPERWDNMIFTTKDVFANDGNGWSDPVHFSFEGYDTSLFWDEDERVYVQGSHSWRVFPAIEQFEIDLNTGESLSGDPVILWNGTGGLAPEGPHMYKRDDGYYYLLIAEGGTGVNHMVTMARAKNISGPYDACPYNPVLTNANTTEYLQTVGHADLFQDTKGNWWAVSLATRNATVDYPMGRETVLVPVNWEEGEFPVFNNGKPGRVHVDMKGPLPPKELPTSFPNSDPLVGHAQHISFSQPLPRQLVYYRLPDLSLFSVSPPERPDTLRILGSAQNISGNFHAGTSSFIARRQDALEFSATVELGFDPQVDGEEAGITLFLQRNQHFDLGVIGVANATSSSNKVEKFIQLRAITSLSTPDGLSDPLSKPGRFLLEGVSSEKLQLKVQAVNASKYAFYYAEVVKGETLQWKVVGYGDASEVSGGFTGTLVGMYATGNGRNSSSPAYFSDFNYDPVLRVY